MLHFEGDRDFTQAPADLWARLKDARFLVQCIPDSEAVSRSEPDLAECRVRPGFTFVRGTLDLTVRVAEAVPATSVRVLVHSKGIGSSSDVEAILDLAPRESGSRLHWSADIKELSGLLKAIPRTLIKAAAQKVIADVWTALEVKLTEQRADL